MEFSSQSPCSPSRAVAYPAFNYLNLDWKKHTEIDPKYFRPTEVEYLKADPSKARKKLFWSPKVSFKDLVKIMVDYDLEQINLPSPGEGKRISDEKNIVG